MNPLLEQISRPALSRRCENHLDTPAEWVLGGHAVCTFCADQILVVAEIGAGPVQGELFHSMR